MRVAIKIELTSEQRRQLEAAARSRSVALRVVERARIVLLAADGLSNDEIARRLSMSRFKVSRWRERYARRGFPGIEKDAPRPGRTPAVGPETVVRMTTQEKPPQATHWSTRRLAALVGVSPSTVRRVWRAHGLKPHRLKTFKISNDPAFATTLPPRLRGEKRGLYGNTRKGRLLWSVPWGVVTSTLPLVAPSGTMARFRNSRPL